MKSSLKKPLISLASLAILLPVLEVGLRVSGFEYESNEPPPMIWNPVQDKLINNGKYLFMPAVRQLWAPRPGADIPWSEGEFVNRHGYRGPVLPKSRKPGVIRIATLGDSSSFGHSVTYEDTYSRQLELALAERGIEAEVLCAGVVGFSLEQGIERYQELVREYEPDVVTLAFGAFNDHLPAPGAIADGDKIKRSIAHNTLGKRLARRSRDFRIGQLADMIRSRIADDAMTVDEAVNKGKQRRQVNKGYEKLDWPGIRHTPIPIFRASLRRALKLIREDGAQPILISMPRTKAKETENPALMPYTRAIEEFADAEDVPLMDARSAFRASEDEGRPWNELLVDIVHPNPKGHALIADGLADIVEGLVRDGKIQAP